MRDTNVKIGVQLRIVKGPEGQEILAATVPMRLIFEDKFDAKWLEEELKKLKGKYRILVDRLIKLLESLKGRTQKGRVLLYWKFGDEIVRFIHESQNSSLFVDNLTSHLTRDTGASEKMINRCKRFRLLYPNCCSIDPTRSFDSYIATFESSYICAKRRKA